MERPSILGASLCIRHFPVKDKDINRTFQNNMTSYIAKVYKLTNSVDNKWYLGSTKNRLAKRIGDHRGNVRDGRMSNIYNHMRETGVENWQITLIEERSVPNKEHQLMFEREKLDELKDDDCLNMCRPHRTVQEKKEYDSVHGRAWRQANPEHNRALIKAWAQANPERTRAIVRASTDRIVAEQRYHCDVCDHSFRRPSALRMHNTSRKHQRAVEQAEE
jgi:hypothetical protein